MSRNEYYRATGLKSVLADQGRRHSWLAAHLGVSKWFMSHVVHGRKVLNEERARRVSELLGVPVFMLFDSCEQEVDVLETECNDQAA